jgi:hypothetical protein
VRCLGIGLGLSGAGIGRRLVGERLALSYLVGLFGSLVADVAGLDAMVLGASVTRYPRDCGKGQNCDDRDGRDQNDAASSHVVS